MRSLMGMATLMGLETVVFEVRSWMLIVMLDVGSGLRVLLVGELTVGAVLAVVKLRLVWRVGAVRPLRVFEFSLMVLELALMVFEITVLVPVLVGEGALVSLVVVLGVGEEDG
jgi:hypothetical protein